MIKYVIYILFSIILLSFSLSSCSYNSKDSTISYNYKCVKNIVNNVDSVLDKSSCYSLKMSSDGYLSRTDCSAATHYLRANALCLSLDNVTETIIDTFPWFAFSYVENSGVVNIRILKGYPSNAALEMHIRLGINKVKDVKLRFISLEHGHEYITNNCTLIIDNDNYKLGDVINGYIYYEGEEKRLKLRRWKYKIFFKCNVGTSTHLLDYINTFPQCEGIVNEVGFGKSRKILAPLGSSVR